MEIMPSYLSSRQAAQYLGIGHNTLRKNWTKWTKFGVNPSRLNGKTDLRFKRSELDCLMDAWRVIQTQRS